MSDFTNQKLWHIQALPNVMDMSSALVGRNISPNYHSINFTPITFQML